MPGQAIAYCPPRRQPQRPVPVELSEFVHGSQECQALDVLSTNRNAEELSLREARTCLDKAIRREANFHPYTLWIMSTALDTASRRA